LQPGNGVNGLVGIGLDGGLAAVNRLQLYTAVDQEYVQAIPHAALYHSLARAVGSSFRPTCEQNQLVIRQPVQGLKLLETTQRQAFLASHRTTPRSVIRSFCYTL